MSLVRISLSSVFSLIKLELSSSVDSVMLPVCCYRENKKYVPFLFLFVLISFFSLFLDEILLIIIKNKEEEETHIHSISCFIRENTPQQTKQSRKAKEKLLLFFFFFNALLCFSLRKPHFHSCKLPLFLFPINKYSSHVNLTHFAFPITSLNNCVRDAFIHLSKVTHF